MAITDQHELLMSDTDFEKISELAYLYTGTVFGPQKKDLVYDRLCRRLRDLNLHNMADYLTLIQSDNQPEADEFINAITTHARPFFDGMPHFNFLKETVWPELKQTNADSKKVRVWSAGCASGEEPYSLAMSLKESFDVNAWDCHILATDIDDNVIEKCQDGGYGIDCIKLLSTKQRQRFFVNDKNVQACVKVKPKLKSLVEFKTLNLLKKWPMLDKFDLIFCRDILIYFNEETQTELVKRFAETLKPGGYLIIGHSEALTVHSQHFTHMGNSIYQKPFS